MVKEKCYVLIVVRRITQWIDVLLSMVFHSGRGKSPPHNFSNSKSVNYVDDSLSDGTEKTAPVVTLPSPINVSSWSLSFSHSLLPPPSTLHPSLRPLLLPHKMFHPHSLHLLVQLFSLLSLLVYLHLHLYGCLTREQRIMCVAILVSLPLPHLYIMPLIICQMVLLLQSHIWEQYISLLWLLFILSFVFLHSLIIWFLLALSLLPCHVLYISLTLPLKSRELLRGLWLGGVAELAISTLLKWILSQWQVPHIHLVV